MIQLTAAESMAAVISAMPRLEIHTDPLWD
jgi:hypothetical protein